MHSLLGDQRIDCRRLWRAVYEHTVARNALKYRTHFFGNSSTRYVHCRGNNLKTRKLEFGKTKLDNGPHCARSDALALSGVPHPIANISHVMALVYVIDCDATQELATVF